MGELAALTNFAFPNDHPHWSLMIVIYPYITGIVAGAFIVSSLFHVFGVKELRPVARFSLLFAFAFLCFATVPLLNHLGHPERAFNMFFTPSPTSAMAGFGYIYSAYALLLIAEILLVYRTDMVALKHKSTGVMRMIYSTLSLGSDNVGPESTHKDHRVATFLAGLGIPMACTLHGYVGFIFGGVKAVSLWATPLMPVIFLLSASVSGIAGIILLYVLIMKRRGDRIDMAVVRSLTKWLWGFFILDFVLEMLEIGMHAYQSTAHWHGVSELLNGPLDWSFWTMQVGILSIIPFIALMWLNLGRVKDSTFVLASSVVSFMLLIQVLFMRWNIVVGGQLLSKSDRGFTHIHPEWLEKEGILPTIIIMSAPFVLLWILSKIFPFWDKKEVEQG